MKWHIYWGFISFLFSSTVLASDSVENVVRTNLGSSVIRRDLERKIQSQFDAIPTDISLCPSWKKDTQSLIDDLRSSGAVASAQQLQERLDCSCLPNINDLVKKLCFLESCCPVDVVISQDMLDANGSFTISKPGSYVLDVDINAQNSVSAAQSVGIFIRDTSDVALDLRGHTVSAGVSDATDLDVGILLINSQRVRISNGNIKDTSIGMSDNADASSGVDLRNITFNDNNVQIALIGQSNCWNISDCRFFDTEKEVMREVITLFNGSEITIKNCKIMSRITNTNLISVNSCSNICFMGVNILNNELREKGFSILQLNNVEFVEIVDGQFIDNIGMFEGEIPLIMNLIDISGLSLGVAITRVLFHNKGSFASRFFFTGIRVGDSTKNNFIDNCRFLFDEFFFGAGAIISLGGTRSVVSNNTTISVGGGIVITGSDLTVADNYFIGGGLLQFSSAGNNIIFGNVASSYSGSVENVVNNPNSQTGRWANIS